MGTISNVIKAAVILIIFFTSIPEIAYGQKKDKNKLADKY